MELSNYTRCILQFGIKASTKFKEQVEEEGVDAKNAPTARTRTLRSDKCCR